MKLEKFKLRRDLITFIIIGKNEEKIIDKCLASLIDFNQEIIFIDSCSDDNSLEILKNYKEKVTIISLNSSGYLHTGSLARSIGAKLAKGKYLQFLDADMTINPDWINNAVNFIEKSNTTAAVVGYKKEYSNIDGEEFRLKRDNFFFKYPDYLSGCFLIDRQIYNLSGGFDPNVPWDEERDLYLRILKVNKKVKYIDTYMANHFDYKTANRKLIFYLINNKHKCFWRIITKVFLSLNFKSYFIVYRHILVILILELITFFALIYLNFNLVIISQLLGLVYAISVRRRGIFLYWKSIFLTTLFYLFKKNKKNYTYNIIS